jgi:hypothetical protein
VNARRSLTIAFGLAIAAGACNHTSRVDSAELALAAAASESVTVALADSIAPGRGYTVYQSGNSVESLSACEDHVDSRGWQSFGSPVLELELPEGFTGSGQTNQIASWNGPGGWIRASTHSTEAHSGWTGLITSECDVFISGSPAHVDLVTTTYGRGVHVLIKVQDAPAIGIEAQTKTLGGQAELLHAIRNARVSAAWGRSE